MHELILSTNNKRPQKTLKTLSIKAPNIAFPQQILSPYTSHPLHDWCPNTPCRTSMRQHAEYFVDVHETVPFAINKEVPRYILRIKSKFEIPVHVEFEF
jgi:hypothetical protein